MKNVLFSAVIGAFVLVGCNNPSEKPTVAAAAPVEAAKPVETTPTADVTKAVETAKPAVETTTKAWVCVAPGALMGMKVGMTIPEAKKLFPIRKTTEKRAEGTVDVYESAQEESDADFTIYVEKKGGKEVITSMELRSDCKTKEGIKVGSTLADLRKAYPKLVAHGSEIESRVTATGGGYSFLLNASSASYNLDQATLKATVKVKAILF